MWENHIRYPGDWNTLRLARDGLLSHMLTQIIRRFCGFCVPALLHSGPPLCLSGFQRLMSGIPTLSATQSQRAFCWNRSLWFFHFEVTLGVEISFLGIFLRFQMKRMKRLPPEQTLLCWRQMKCFPFPPAPLFCNFIVVENTNWSQPEMTLEC